MCWIKIHDTVYQFVDATVKTSQKIFKKIVVTLVYLIVLSVLMPDDGGRIVVLFQLGKIWEYALLGSIHMNYQLTCLMPSRS